jgi:hypothetical protein
VECVSLVDVEPACWLEKPRSERERVHALCAALAVEGQGAAAISKVLALLAPRTVPLMDDPAIALLTGRLGGALTDVPTAGAEHVVPMLDAFCDLTLRNLSGLEELSRAYEPCPLTPAQVLDRLLWFDSWGGRFLRRT